LVRNKKNKATSPFIDNSDVVLHVEGEAAKKRWSKYFGTLLPTRTPVDDPQPGISIAEIKAAISTFVKWSYSL
jgi:hypothetical protein